MKTTQKWLDGWDSLKFDNRFTRELPGDPDSTNETRQVYDACYSRVEPAGFSAPALVAHSSEVAESLGLPESLIESEQFANVFGGSAIHPEMDPFAMCYGGHQFGNWAGQLGDGRAINLCEVIDKDGEHQTLQLKGAGPTPYSRFADGLAVLRSSVREFLCSEAMHHLGIPTTRALSLVLTGDRVTRDMFYDGHPKAEPGAIVCRVAPSFVRLGSFQIFSSRQDFQTLRLLTDYSIRHDFPELGSPSPESPDIYAAFFDEVCRRTAELMVHWMRVGFVHGVMNTDNLSVLGLTIDYGPYGWLDDFDPHWTPNTTDAEGKRYRYGHQPQIAQWNLSQFGGSLLHLVDNDTEKLQPGLRTYVDTFERKWNQMMAGKLGLGSYQDGDDQLFADLFEVLQLAETDMTLFFRSLADLPCEDEQVDRLLDHCLDDPSSYLMAIGPLSDAYYQPDQLSDETRRKTCDWLMRYRTRVRETTSSDDERRRNMNSVNPLYVPRNYLVQLAIDRSEQGDHAGIAELLDVFRRPYEEQTGKEAFAEKRPDWAKHRAGCSMLSCSS